MPAPMNLPFYRGSLSSSPLPYAGGVWGRGKERVTSPSPARLRSHPLPRRGEGRHVVPTDRVSGPTSGIANNASRNCTKENSAIVSNRGVRSPFCQYIREQRGDARGRLAELQITGRRLAAAAVLDDVVLHGLSLVERVDAGLFDGADMDEDVLAAVIRLDEAVALLGVEPFDFA